MQQFSSEEIREEIAEIVYSIYGKGDWVDSFLEVLCAKLATTEGGFDRFAEAERICWIWFSGGGVAATAAMRIETALQEAGRK